MAWNLAPDSGLMCAGKDRAEGRQMKRLARIAVCLMAVAALTACTAFYNDITYPEARYNLGDQ
jgi:hypothetical protein